jgi:hypothetical protein
MLYKNSVGTSQEKRYQANGLMLFRETNTVYWENHMKHTNTFYKQNTQF